MLRLSQSRQTVVWALALATLATVLALPLRAGAQDDPNDVPLGDVARNMRKKVPPAKGVIDDDNLSTVMDQIDSKRASGSSLKFLMAGDSKNFQVSAPDATCSLSFNANAKALLSSQYAQMELPAAEVAKLEGPATIEGDALSVSVFNHTDWHVSEVAVALIVVRKNEPGTTFSSGPDAGVSPNTTPQFVYSPDAVRPEKKPDRTVVYRIRAAAPPSMTTVFSAPLNMNLEPGEEWHWAIIQAKGYPPEGRYREARIEPTPTVKDLPPSLESTGPTTEEPAPLGASPVSMTQPQ